MLLYAIFTRYAVYNESDDRIRKFSQMPMMVDMAVVDADDDVRDDDALLHTAASATCIAAL